MRWWKLLESLRDGMSGQYAFLPFGGALGDQPDWLMHDLSLIGEYSKMIQEQLKGSLPKEAE